MPHVHRPRRSCLYMPGANARVLEKGKSLPADTLILDLEDAVAPDSKVNARGITSAAVQSGGYGQREIVIRINGLDTEWGKDDLLVSVAARPNAILAPKVTTGSDIELLNSLMDDAGAPPELALWVMIEMPQAILNILEIAEAGKRTRLTGFVMGTNDLAKELCGVNDAPIRTAFQTSLGLAILAARSSDLLAIDGVFNDIDDERGLIAECQQGRVMGFDGKTLIHPSQIETANRVFAPSEAEIEQAKAVIKAFADPANAGKGVLKVNGKMTEILHLEQAKRTVQVAESISAMGSVD